MTEFALEREVAAIRLDLQSRDDEIRRIATERMLGLSTDDALPMLLDALGDTSWRVRKAAVDQLAGSIDSPNVVSSLIEALADEVNSGRRNAALEALVGGGAEVVEAAIAGLSSDDVDVRKQLVDTLAGIGDERARDPLLACLADSDANVRGAAADALGVIGGAGVVDALEERIVDGEEDPLVRVSSLRALGARGVAVSPARLGEVLSNPILRPHAYALLAGCPEPEALAVLLKGLEQRGRSSRLAAIDALLDRLAAVDPTEVDSLAGHVRETAAQNEGLVPWAAEQLRGSELAVRLRLIQFLAVVGDPRAVVPIAEVSTDPALRELGIRELASMGAVATECIDAQWDELTPRGRIVAAELYAECGGGADPRRMLEAIEDPDPCLRMGAARALSRSSAEIAIPPLLRRLDLLGLESDAETDEERAELTDALRDCTEGEGRAAAIARLAECMDGSSESVRVAIAQVVSSSGEGTEAAFVARLMKDPSPLVRREAVCGVARFEGEAVHDVLRLALADESKTVRVSAARALGETGRVDVLCDLERLTADADVDVAAAALRAAGRLASESRAPELVSAVLKLVRGAEEAPTAVAIGAVEALDQIATADAGRLAIAFLARPESELLRLAAACVGRHGERPVLNELVPLVGHEAWEVRAEAIRALGERGFAPAVTAIMRRQEHEQHDYVRTAILRSLRRLEA